MAVLRPVKLIVDNYPAGRTEDFCLANNPNREACDCSTRSCMFSRELWIEADDFAEVPPPKFKRLTVGGEVRLMGAYIVRCTGVDKNPDGSIAAIHCTADLETGCGNPADGRKVKGTIHWVSAEHCIEQAGSLPRGCKAGRQVPVRPQRLLHPRLQAPRRVQPHRYSAGQL